MHFLQTINSDISVLIVCNKTGGTIKGDIKKNPSLLAGGSTTMRSKKPLPCALHHRRHHSTMKGYIHWCIATTSASKLVENMSKSSVKVKVHQSRYRPGVVQRVPGS